MIHSFWKAGLTVVATAIATLVVERAVLPSLAQGDPTCGTVASNSACGLTGYKLLLNDKSLMIASVDAVLPGAYSPRPLHSGDGRKNPGVSSPAPIQ